ncbi:type II secretion system minor pseudopilin GspI [Methylobacter sp.]|uniref:type II secretion system minor pseudopilin GspI n=1 Tax=Methylobacter sp. TaxID=2051955 RepID=UPI0025E6B0BE|nr:type II secretion system minor pseudopilin GspI [Methylobacter sp.]
MNMSCRTHRANGFTLLEVLIALAILAILMVSAIKITAENIKNLWYLENKTIASIIASNHAVQLRLDKEKPESQDGWDQMAGRRWYWQIKRNTNVIAGVWRYRIEVFLEGDKAPYFSLISDVIKS